MGPLFTASCHSHVASAASGSPAGLNFAAHQPNPPPPIPGTRVGAQVPDGSQNSLLTSLVYHVDRMANPETSAKPGPLGLFEEMGEFLST